MNLYILYLLSESTFCIISEWQTLFLIQIYLCSPQSPVSFLIADPMIAHIIIIVDGVNPSNPF